MDILRELSEQLGKGNVVLFCGAGISVSDGGIPSGGQLAKELFERAELGDVGGMTLPEVAQAYELDMGHQSLIAFIAERIEGSGHGPLRTHHLIAALPFKRIITTNWDTLLEAALREAGKSVVKIVRDEDVAYFDEEKVTLIKLHGTVDQKDTLVVTGDDYYDVFARLPVTANLVHGYFATKTVLFLGYGLADEDFKRMYHEVERHLGKHKRRAYAVQLNPTALAVKYWQQKNVQVIMADATAFLEALAGQLGMTGPPSAPTSTGTVPVPPLSATSPTPSRSPSSPIRHAGRSVDMNLEGPDALKTRYEALVASSPHPQVVVDRPWRGGEEITVLGQVYVLHDPVEETWAADHSFVRRRAKAWQPDSDRLVRIKQVQVQRSTPETGETCKILRIEGQLLGKLERLPDFPRLSAVVGDEIAVTVVYSYTDGPNLSQVFGAPGQPLDSHSAYRLLRSLLPLCSMLGELHRLGVSHRHLSPEEIVLLPGRHDHAVLRDIGLAAQPVAHQEGPALYRAPEQARKTLQPPGPATDIYQVAAVLYHFLTGRLPAAFLGQMEAPSIFNRDLPSALDEALLRAFAQEPTNRWSGIRDFQRALDQAARQLRDQLRGMS